MRRAGVLVFAWLVLGRPGVAAGVGRSTLRQPGAARGASFDARSFLVGKRRTLLLCGGLHYFRLLPEEWGDRVLQTRLAGFNMVETPVPWNLHEPTQGAFRFEGPADLRRFLELCREQKLLVLLRIGPYVNAAVTNGGLPAWLGEDPRVKVRGSDRKYMAAVAAWWAKLMAVVRAQQVPTGPVAMLQVEDHYPGTDRSYPLRLYELAERLGAKVPVVLSELNPRRNFAQVRVPEPSFFATTELLPAGPLRWGDSYRSYPHLDTILFEGFAKGIDGYNHAMWCAGTNLALLQASAYPTRFEAGTCGIQEDGALDDGAGDAKKVNLFARTFEQVLAGGGAVRSHPLLSQASRGGMVALARGDGTTTLLFLRRRSGAEPLTLTDEATGQRATVPVSSAGYRHVVAGFPLTASTTLALSSAQVLTVRRLGRRLLVVVYAPVGAQATMVFRTATRPAVRAGGEALTWDAGRKQLVLTWACEAKLARADFVFGAGPAIHVAAVEESLAARTWVLDGAGVLVGAPHVGPWTGGAAPTVEMRLPSARTRLRASFYPSGPARTVGKALGVLSPAYDEAAGRIDFRIDLRASRPIPVLLRRWETATELAETAPGFNDRDWAEHPRPTPLGEARYGWYRCRFTAARAEPKRLRFRNVADAVTVYLNGEYAGQSSTKSLTDAKRNFAHPAAFELSVRKGENVLAVLAKNWGRYRNTATYNANLSEATGWGIVGEVLLGSRALLRWRQKEGLAPAGRRLAWRPVGKTRVQAPRWYRVRYTTRKHPARVVQRVAFRGLGHGAVWFNGHFVGLYQQLKYDASHGCLLPHPWARDQNELVVFEEAPGYIPADSEVRASRESSLIPIKLTFGP